jgi:transcriptional regulator with XRE-family HTH domain
VGVSVNDTIRDTRLRLGLTKDEVAARVGLSRNEYLDLELHDHEAFDVVRLRNMKEIAEVLQLDVLDLFGFECAFCERPELAAPGLHLSRADVLRHSREAVGLSQDDLADRIGFETLVVAQMESDPEFLESWSVGLCTELASVLGVPPQVLLGVRCAACGR